jgi:hypothetical protein
VKGFRRLAVEALNRLGIETEPTRLERACSAGQTTQVPAGRVVAVRKRVRRKIGYNGVTLSFERARSGTKALKALPSPIFSSSLIIISHRK